MRKLLLIATATFLSSCGVIDTSQYLNVDMYGVYVAPVTQEVTETDVVATPYALNVTLVGVSGVRTDGSALQWEIDDVSDLTIVDRAQRIFQLDLADLEDETFSQLVVTFESDYTLSLKGEDTDLAGTFTTSAITYDTAFQVETGKDLDFSLKVSWQDIIVNSQIVTEPALAISKD
mgnify:CR=1 FL=1